MKPPLTFPVAKICALAILALTFALAGCGKRSASPSSNSAAAKADDEFMSLMNSGKNYLDKNSSTQAIIAFEKAVKLQPTQADAHLNLANAHLLAGDAEAALKQAREVIALDNNSAAAHFIAGCALNRMAQPLEAIKELTTSRDLDPSVAATDFQLGMAQMQLKQYEEAANSFQAALDLEPEHLSAHYNLSQALTRAGRNAEAQQELEAHQALLAKYKGPPPTPAMFEKSAHTAARVPFRLEQPDKSGVRVAFKDVTAAMLGEAAKSYVGPVGILDINHRGANDLFVLENGKNFRLLLNTNGTFKPVGESIAAIDGNKYRKLLVGDLQNDRFEDVVALGEKGVQVFSFATNGAFIDNTAFTRLQGLGAIDGALVDLDFTGKLDLFAVTATNDLRLFRNLGNMFFRDITATSGIPAGIKAAQKVVLDDWNNDDLMDVTLAREGQPPLLLLKQRGGILVATNAPTWPAGTIIASGDLNNDLRIDTVIASNGKLECRFGSLDEARSIDSGNITALKLIDYDNDGWLDILAATSNGLRLWRNVGQQGFLETTEVVGLKNLTLGAVTAIHSADFDNDCASDLLLETDTGLKILRNEGANANHQIKVRLYGNRSNASGLGVKVEAQTGGLRTIRTVSELPVEIGAGKYSNIETLTVRWFDLAVPSLDVKVECTNLLIAELILPTGSCPYLYAWDGTKHRFVTDILGAAPLGLPVAEGHYIEADPDEIVWIGNDTNFKPLNGAYQLQITEELREVLYLDEAKLMVVDHPPGTEVHSTDKLVPGKPFPPTGLITLGARKPLLHARTLEGADVTQVLNDIDQVMVSPAKIHIPQRRGMAEPHGVELDFGALPTDRPLVLALTGWLRFGGGMANIATSQLPDLPFPFPVLEVERDGQWQKVDVTAGAPAGKTKTIVIDLAGKLPAGSHKLRLTASFEIHWDRIALFEKMGEANTHIATLAADTSHLHWRGFSEFADLPWTQPLTPKYEVVTPDPKWRVAVSGWCTRYGSVDELITKRDDALVLINGGDELTLRFGENRLPQKSSDSQRDYFLYVDGWDKDADFHVASGTKVEPLPWHGLNDQTYATDPRPTTINDTWTQKYNTRWVGPETLKRHSIIAKNK